MYISNTIPVDATPTQVVPTPTISPKSPSYVEESFISLVTLGTSIRTSGTEVLVYPVPGEVTVIAETASPVRVDVADAQVVVPRPTGVPIITSGAAVYPVPPKLTVTAEIVPAADTTAVAAAPTILS